MMKRFHSGQMSDSMAVGILLSLTGGFQDAYTYICRGSVFANAQTGNFILMGINASEGRFQDALRYLIPIAAFGAGIFLAQRIRHLCQPHRRIHWRQIILAIECVILFTVGLIPESLNILANSLVSFSCAMQVDSFRKIQGNAMATTMCIGNLRSATDLLHAYTVTKDPIFRKKSLQYYFFIAVFAIGAVLGNGAVKYLGLRAVWVCCGGILAAGGMMFIKGEE